MFLVPRQVIAPTGDNVGWSSVDDNAEDEPPWCSHSDAPTLSPLREAEMTHRQSPLTQAPTIFLCGCVQYNAPILAVLGT